MLFGRHINRYYLRYSWILLIGIAALVLVDWFQLKVPELYRMVINGMNTGYVAVNGQDVPFDTAFLLNEICLPLIFVILAMVTGRFLWRVCFFGSSIGVETDLRNRMFDRCKGLSQQYFRENKVGNMMSLFTNDLETVQDCFGDGVLMLCDATFLGLLTVFKMWKMDVILTLLSLIPMALLMCSGAIIARYMMKKWALRQQAFSDLSDFSQESFSGISVIKAFVKAGAELMSFRRLNRRNEDVNVDYTRAATLLNITVTLFVEAVICIILGYGGYLVYAGTFDAGQLVEYIGYFSTIVWPVMAVSQLIEMTSRGKASLRRIGELLDARPDICDKSGAEELSNPRGEIEFRSLSFTYPDGEIPALDGMSFKIAAGEHVGIVGRTGAGKTTIADLILRAYNVPDGTLFLDGKDVNSLTVSSVRAACAYVPQDNFLFGDSIANNIAFAADGADADRIAQVARLAAVDGDIREFPEGYATITGERGVTLSGGQKQRISLARAYLKDAAVLLLDDAVSAVDTSTEREILSNIRNFRRGRTTVLIAHRISTVADMDRIIFISEGRVVATGRHEELCRTCPEYARIVDLQRLEEEGREHNG